MARDILSGVDLDEYASEVIVAPPLMQRRNILWIALLAALFTVYSLMTSFINMQDSMFLIISAVGLIPAVVLIIWECQFQGELKRLTGEGFNPWGHFWMQVFTFGIYKIYWNYAAANRLHSLGAPDRSKTYLWVSIVAAVIAYIIAFLMIGEIIYMFIETIANLETLDTADKIINDMLKLIWPYIMISMACGWAHHGIFMSLQNDANKLT